MLVLLHIIKDEIQYLVIIKHKVIILYDLHSLLLQYPFQQGLDIFKMIIESFSVYAAVGYYLADCYF